MFKSIFVLVGALFATSTLAGIIHSDDLGKVNKGRTTYASDTVGKTTDWLNTAFDEEKKSVKDYFFQSDWNSTDSFDANPDRLHVSVSTSDLLTLKDLSVKAQKDVPTSVPEPGALALMGLGLIGVVVAKRQRRDLV